MVHLLLILLLCFFGCKTPQPVPSRETITYTFDAQTRELIRQLAQQEQLPAYQHFDRHFKGLFVPESLLAFEPFVLGLATESKIPTVLLLDAPWVHRYALTGWLYELERTGVFQREVLVPAVAAAFSVSRDRFTGQPGKELMAVPTSIKGNILFYRQDLLSRYQQTPPRTWTELKAICQKILPREPSLKYGLVFHVNNFVNDFYPVFWGFGGAVLDDQGHLVLPQPENLAAGSAALRQLCEMQGSLVPGPTELEKFKAPKSLRQAFFDGETLFMINWNTRMHDLKNMLQQVQGTHPGGLHHLHQIGVTPIPCQAGQPHRYSNVGSFGWAINRFAITNPRTIDTAKQFIHLVTDERYQVLAAETLGQIPALKSALEQVKNKEVRQVYEQIFASPDVVLRPRPQSRLVNNALEKNLLEALSGRLSPEAALTAAAKEVQASLKIE